MWHAVCGWVRGEYVEWGGGRLWHNSILEEIF